MLRPQPARIILRRAGLTRRPSASHPPAVIRRHCHLVKLDESERRENTLTLRQMIQMTPLAKSKLPTAAMILAV